MALALLGAMNRIAARLQPTSSTTRLAAQRTAPSAAPLDARRDVDALLRRANVKTLDAPKADVDTFELSNTTAPMVGRTPRDNGIIASLDTDPAQPADELGPTGALRGAQGNVDTLHDQIRAGLARAGLSPSGYGASERGPDPLGDQLSAHTGGADIGPATDVPGIAAAPSLLGDRSAARAWVSADAGDKSGDAAATPGDAAPAKSASEKVVEAIEDAAAKVPGAVKEFAAGAAGAILPWVAGAFAGVGFSTRDDASLRDTANGIIALDGGTMGSLAGKEPGKGRNQLTDPDADRAGGPSETTKERAAQRGGGLINPVGNPREIDPAKLAAATVIAILSKVNPVPGGGRDTPQGPIVSPGSGVADPPAPTVVRGGPKPSVPGGPPRAGGPLGPR